MPEKKLQLPPKTNATLAELYRAQQQAVKEFQQALSVAMEFLGLDNGNHHIDFTTGIVTPEVKTPASEPTPIRAEA